MTSRAIDVSGMAACKAPPYMTYVRRPLLVVSKLDPSCHRFCVSWRYTDRVLMRLAQQQYGIAYDHGGWALEDESCVMFALPDGWSLFFWLILSFGCAALIGLALVSLSVCAVFAMFPSDRPPSEPWPYDGE